MKNIHLLPTDKPSRLHFDSELFVSPKYQLSSSINSIVQGRHIYITSDEEIKEGDWFISIPRGTIHKCTGIFENNLIDKTWENREEVEITKADCKKIILTTDQDLIAEGVQSIDDEFLEWFIKNPSCEFVEIDIKTNIYPALSDYYTGTELRRKEYSYEYKIIIPKEESIRKIDTCYNFDMEIGCVQDICRCEQEERLTYTESAKKEEKIFNANMLKQETLEEVSKNYATEKRQRKHLSNREFDLCQRDFIQGAKWQAEQDKNKYSEEDVCKMLDDKKNEMVDFLNRYLSQKERNRIGEDIIRIIPNKGDLSKLYFK